LASLVHGLGALALTSTLALFLISWAWNYGLAAWKLFLVKIDYFLKPLHTASVTKNWIIGSFWLAAILLRMTSLRPWPWP